MTIQNPNYMYYKQLADTWKSADGSITAILTDTVNITVNYGNATINGYYDVVPAGPDMTTSFQGLMGLGMMGVSDGFSYQHNFGDDMKIKLGETALKKDDVTAYNIISAWHDIVGFRDGENMVGASTESMPGVSGAYYELMNLFTTASVDN